MTPSRPPIVAFADLMSTALRHAFQDFCAAEHLSATQLWALHLLDRPDGCKMSELSRELPLSPGATTSVADHLVERGLAVRCARTVDRRSVRLGASDAGRCLLQRFDDMRARAVCDAIGQLPPSDRAVARAALETLLGACDGTAARA